MMVYHNTLVMPEVSRVGSKLVEEDRPPFSRLGSKFVEVEKLPLVA